MSALSQFLSGGVKSIQHGTVDTSTVSAGTDPEGCYVNVTISSVTTSKAVILSGVQFGAHDSNAVTALKFAREGVIVSSPSTATHAPAKFRFVNSTTVRFYSGGTYTHNAFSGNFTVVEYK